MNSLYFFCLNFLRDLDFPTTLMGGGLSWLLFWSDASASDHMDSSCRYHFSQISLNIHFTGIHALANLFSVTFYKTWDLYEIFRPTLKFGPSMEPILELPLHSEVQHLCRSRCGRLLLHHISLTHGVHKHPDRYQRTIKPLIP